MPQRKAASRLRGDICAACNCVTTHLALPSPNPRLIDHWTNRTGTAELLTLENGETCWVGCIECIHNLIAVRTADSNHNYYLDPEDDVAARYGISVQDNPFLQTGD